MNKKIKVLIAEDEPVILRSIKRGIESFSGDFEVAAVAYDGNEALELMEEDHYDIVITDIVMPLMGGLEMISEARRRGKLSKFVLISGYDKFEFAQKAIEVGVAKYLLKPVDFEQLRMCLEELQGDIHEKNRTETQRYLQDLSYKYQELKEIREREFYYIFTIISGCLGRSEYDKLPQEVWMQDDEFGKLLKMLEEKYKKNIYQIPGHYPNEKLLIVPCDTPRWQDIPKFAEELYEKLQMKKFFSVCYFNKAVNGGDFQKQLTDLHCEIPLHIIFGRNTLQCLGGKGMELDYEVTEDLKSLIRKMSMAVTREEICKYVMNCVKVWKEKGLTQFQLQVEIRYLIEHMLNGKSCNSAEILYGKESYEELERELAERIMQHFFEDSRRKMAKSDLLAESVKDYLDEHFTEDIIYKDFNRLFGYNEKYITTVFKEKNGISPSRYVLEKRMEKAKEILLSEEGILLKEAAEKVGYSDPLYFSKVFKNSTGMSPSTYLKLYGNLEK